MATIFYPLGGLVYSTPSAASLTATVPSGFAWIGILNINPGGTPSISGGSSTITRLANDPSGNLVYYFVATGPCTISASNGGSAYYAQFATVNVNNL